MVFSYFFGELMLTVLFNQEFSEYSYLLYLFSITIALNMSGSVYDASLLLANALKLQPYFLVVASIITLVFGFIMIKDFGILGAGYTLVLFNLLNTAFKCLNYNYSIRKSGKYV